MPKINKFVKKKINTPILHIAHTHYTHHITHTHTLHTYTHIYIHTLHTHSFKDSRRSFRTYSNTTSQILCSEPAAIYTSKTGSLTSFHLNLNWIWKKLDLALIPLETQLKCYYCSFLLWLILQLFLSYKSTTNFYFLFLLFIFIFILLFLYISI